jgi:hypothetical protein
MIMTKRELAKKQIELQNKVLALAKINIVTCGNCGCVLLHDTLSIECASCKSVMDICDCPDLWYEGCQNNSEFDEDEPIKDEEIYLGNIEQGITNLKVYANDYGYKIYIYSNGNLMAECELLDSDHVWRELRARGYKKSFCKVVLGML